MIWDLVVKSSFTEARHSKAPPMVSIEMVSADDPVVRENTSEIMS